jgi:tetratricopeptide (TPR) repeat protein
LISKRKPSFGQSDQIPSIKVPQLETMAIKRLLKKRFRELRITASDEEISDLSAYIAGYPPAVTFVAEMANSIGLAQVIYDKSHVVEFTTTYMIKALEEQKYLSEMQKQVLIILAFYSPLPIEIIGKCLVLPAVALTAEMQYLFDLSFVVPEGRMVRLSDPLVNAVIRAFARGWSGHSNIARELEQYLSDTDDDDSRFTLARSLYRALNLSGQAATSEYAIRLTADIVELSQHYYHERDYSNAIKFCKLALEKRPDNVAVRSYLVRALIQKGEYERADEEINRIVETGHLKDAWFLRGFYHRYQNQYGRAVEAYKKAIEHGRKGVAVHRDLAQCYHEVGIISLAKFHIEEAQKKDPDNGYIVDLQIQIALKQGEDRALIDRQLAVLKTVDDERFFYYRRSTVHYRFHERSVRRRQGVILAI